MLRLYINLAYFEKEIIKLIKMSKQDKGGRHKNIIGIKLTRRVERNIVSIYKWVIPDTVSFPEYEALSGTAQNSNKITTIVKNRKVMSNYRSLKNQFTDINLMTLHGPNSRYVKLMKFIQSCNYYKKKG